LIYEKGEERRERERERGRREEREEKSLTCQPSAILYAPACLPLPLFTMFYY